MKVEKSREEEESSVREAHEGGRGRVSEVKVGRVQRRTPEREAVIRRWGEAEERQWIEWMGWRSRRGRVWLGLEGKRRSKGRSWPVERPAKTS